MWRNSNDNYGLISRALHWLLAVSIIGMFGLGLWMVTLDYYHAWYRSAPDLHRSIGVLVVLAMVFRCIWMFVAGKPRSLSTHTTWERYLALLSHGMMYLLVWAIGVTGYMISTADGRALDVFNLFSIPSSGEWLDNQEDVAGWIHEWLAYTLIVIVSLHVLAVVKHVWIDKDSTLRRMAGNIDKSGG